MMIHNASTAQPTRTQFGTDHNITSQLFSLGVCENSNFTGCKHYFAITPLTIHALWGKKNIETNEFQAHTLGFPLDHRFVQTQIENGSQGEINSSISSLFSHLYPFSLSLFS